MSDDTHSEASTGSEVQESSVALREDVLLARVAHISRGLYQALQGLGLDTDIRAVLAMVPDVGDRFAYIEKVSEDAATRTLNAVDCARSAQDELATQCRSCSRRWNDVHVVRPSCDVLVELIANTRGAIQAVPRISEATQAQLTEILIAQSFQDLTGQVLRRVTEIVLALEFQLAELLTDEISPARRAKFASTVASRLSAQPVSKAPELDEVVLISDQVEVDDLLSSLGF